MLYVQVCSLCLLSHILNISPLIYLPYCWWTFRFFCSLRLLQIVLQWMFMSMCLSPGYVTRCGDVGSWDTHVYSALVGIAKKIPKMIVPIYTSTRSENSNCFTFLLTLKMFILAIMVSVLWYFFVVLICIFLMTHEVEYLQIYLLAMWITPLWIASSRPFPIFFYWTFFLIDLSSIFIYSGCESFDEFMYCKYLSPLCDLPFYFQTYIWQVKVLILIGFLL